jgi:hypothetical protein
MTIKSLSLTRTFPEGLKAGVRRELGGLDEAHGLMMLAARFPARREPEIVDLLDSLYHATAGEFGRVSRH